MKIRASSFLAASIASHEKIPPERVAAIAEEMRQVLAQETLMAYVAGLRQKAGVKINKELLEKKQ